MFTRCEEGWGLACIGPSSIGDSQWQRKFRREDNVACLFGLLYKVGLMSLSLSSLLISYHMNARSNSICIWHVFRPNEVLQWSPFGLLLPIFRGSSSSSSSLFDIARYSYLLMDLRPMFTVYSITISISSKWFVGPCNFVCVFFGSASSTRRPCPSSNRSSLTCATREIHRKKEGEGGRKNRSILFAFGHCWPRQWLFLMMMMIILTMKMDESSSYTAGRRHFQGDSGTEQNQSWTTSHAFLSQRLQTSSGWVKMFYQ